VTSIAVLVPVLGRPANAAPLVESIGQAATYPTQIVFLCTPGDDEQITACIETAAVVCVTEWEGGKGDYARKINHGLEITTADWIFTGADDLRFRHGWDTAAIHAARAGAGVVGTIDGCNQRTRNANHSTHSLVARWYAVEHGTVEARPAIYHEGYWHNFVDDELVATARARRSYVPSTAHVQHLHPMRGTADDDDTYRLAMAHFRDDRHTFRARRALWGRGKLAQARRPE
jgi:hypothetical protein